MNENEYDVVVIGAGPGGYVSAIRTAQLGLKTAIVDKQWLGGICLNVGCIPSKALLKNAELAYTLRNRAKDFGITFEALDLDFGAAVRRSRKVADRLRRGVETLMKKNNVKVHMGEARLVANDVVQIHDHEGGDYQIKAKNIVLATGAHAMYFPGWEVDGKSIFTYREAIMQEHLPESAIIVGGGAIGAEFATLWSSYGTEVTLVEMLPQILPLEDVEIGAEMAKSFRRYRVKIMTGHRVQSVKKSENGAKVVVLKDGIEKTLEAEQVLIASGFRPNTAGLGLEEVGVNLDERGYIAIDDYMRTNVPGIWAIGDVTGKLLLAHVASAQGIVAAESIAGVKTETLNYQMMPKATYSHPEVASFGYTEEQAAEIGCEVKVGRFPFLANGKALGLGESNGFAKIVSNAKTGEILGAHLVGPNVSELLPELTLAWKMGATAEEIARNVHAHPTLGEVIMEATQIYTME